MYHVFSYSSGTELQSGLNEILGKGWALVTITDGGVEGGYTVVWFEIPQAVGVIVNDKVAENARKVL